MLEWRMFDELATVVSRDFFNSTRIDVHLIYIRYSTCVCVWPDTDVGVYSTFLTHSTRLNPFNGDALNSIHTN